MRARRLRIVAGTQLRSIVRFWSDPGFAARFGGVGLMLSFAEFLERRGAMRAAAKSGMRQYLGFQGDVFLDNGSFTLGRSQSKSWIEEYVNFVQVSKPHWFPVPVDYIPSPAADSRVARRFAEQTHRVNHEFGARGYVPVVHVGRHFTEYFQKTITMLQPSRLAVGGIVPYLRSTRGASPRVALERLAQARRGFEGSIHVFGFGGGITSLHLAAALRIDTVDSSAWRVRASRSLIILPGLGERFVGRGAASPGTPLSREDRALLDRCECPSCETGDLTVLSEGGKAGFSRRAVHNLFVLSQEAKLLNEHRGRCLRRWSLERLKANRLRYLVEHAHDLRS